MTGLKKSFVLGYQSDIKKHDIDEDKILWLTDNIWCAVDPEALSENDINIILNAKRKNLIDFNGRVLKPTTVVPPSFFGKVASFWKAISGPRVDEQTYQDRLDMCTKNGGNSWSLKRGVVTKVYDYGFEVEGLFQPIFKDEVLTIKEGDEVLCGELVTRSDNVKPCQYLLTKEENKLFCNACGCGVRNKAELHNKLEYARLTCPRTVPLFTEVTIESKK